MAKAQPQKMNWWYDGIMEWMLGNPSLDLKDCAEFFNVSQAWLSCIVNSDAFQAVWRERRTAHFEHVSRDLTTQVRGLAALSAEKLATRVEREGDTMPVAQLRETADMALKALGFAPAHGNSASASMQNVDKQTNIFVTDPAALESAREKMRRINAANEEELNANTQAPRLIEVSTPEDV